MEPPPGRPKIVEKLSDASSTGAGGSAFLLKPQVGLTFPDMGTSPR